MRMQSIPDFTKNDSAVYRRIRAPASKSVCNGYKSYLKACLEPITVDAPNFRHTWMSSASASIGEKPEIRYSPSWQERSQHRVPNCVKPIRILRKTKPPCPAILPRLSHSAVVEHLRRQRYELNHEDARLLFTPADIPTKPLRSDRFLTLRALVKIVFRFSVYHHSQLEYPAPVQPSCISSLLFS